MSVMVRDMLDLDVLVRDSMGELAAGPPAPRPVVYRGMERKRLVADRFRRIWYIVEDIAQTPGKSRRELADKFHLSERQVQADLNIIRADMRLPLIRRQGYRFIGEGPASGVGCPDLREAQLLVMVLRGARQDRSIPKGRIDALVAKLPAMFSPHLMPLVERTLEAVMAPSNARHQQVFAALGDALLRGSSVKLHYAIGISASIGCEPVIKPELLLPYLRSWFVVGEIRRTNSIGHEYTRQVMLPLDECTAVTLQADARPAGGW